MKKSVISPWSEKFTKGRFSFHLILTYKLQKFLPWPEKSMNLVERTTPCTAEASSTPLNIQHNTTSFSSYHQAMYHSYKHTLYSGGN